MNKNLKTMKTVIITVKGKGPIYWMENLMDPENYENVPLDEEFWYLEEEGYLDGDLYELPLILEDILVLQSSNPEKPVWDLDDEGAIDITKKKGKYILTNNYFSGVCELKAPFYYTQRNFCEIYETFSIELQDDEEFDPKKFQLIKSDYELDFLPFAIASRMAMYDGKSIFADPSDGYKDKGDCESDIYNEKQPYASQDKSKEFVMKGEYPLNTYYTLKEE